MKNERTWPEFVIVTLPDESVTALMLVGSDCPRPKAPSVSRWLMAPKSSAFCSSKLRSRLTSGVYSPSWLRYVALLSRTVWYWPSVVPTEAVKLAKTASQASFGTEAGCRAAFRLLQSKGVPAEGIVARVKWLNTCGPNVLGKNDSVSVPW